MIRCTLIAPEYALAHRLELMAPKRSSHVFTAVIVDLVLVTGFGIVGHWTHGGDMSLVGIAETSWPFLAGLAAAWLLTCAWQQPLSPLRTGVGLWAATILIGMMIRAFLGDGTAGAFIIVAGLLNFATLVGWRVVATAVAGRGGR